MKKTDVKLGEVYEAKVSGIRTRVRLDRESQYGGWDATNLLTGRTVRIRTAARLRRVLVTAGLVLALLAGCGAIVEGNDLDADTSETVDAQDPEVDTDIPETTDDTNEIAIEDGGISCDPDSCLAYCTVVGYPGGYCVLDACTCVAGGDADASDVDDADASDVDGDGEETPDVTDAEDDSSETEDVVEVSDVEDATDIEDDSSSDEASETTDGSTRTCLEPPEGGHADFETGSLLPFETDSDCDPGETLPRADRTHAHESEMSALLFAPTSGSYGCGLQQLFYPLGGTRTSMWVLIPSAEWWNECASYPCTEAELASGPLVLGVLFRRDGGIQVGGFSAITTWTANTWNLVERDYTCVGATGYRIVTRVNGIVGRDATVTDSGVVCPPPMLPTVTMVKATRFWVDDYCVEELP